MVHNPEQVQMVWPDGKQAPNLDAPLPGKIQLRTYRPGDEVGFFELMDSVGWTGWDEAKLHPWLYRILPEGWFMLVDQTSGEIIGSCMATHDHTRDAAWARSSSPRWSTVFWRLATAPSTCTPNIGAMPPSRPICN